ncbi:MAG: hypothetical protein ACO3U1_06705 [Marivivens sp.]
MQFAGNVDRVETVADQDRQDGRRPGPSCKAIGEAFKIDKDKTINFWIGVVETFNDSLSAHKIDGIAVENFLRLAVPI